MQLYHHIIVLLTLSVSAILPQLLPFSALIALVGGIASWLATRRLLPRVRELMLSKGIFGLDLNKKGSEAGEKKIP